MGCTLHKYRSIMIFKSLQYEYVHVFNYSFDWCLTMSLMKLDLYDVSDEC